MGAIGHRTQRQACTSPSPFDTEAACAFSVLIKVIQASSLTRRVTSECFRCFFCCMLPRHLEPPLVESNHEINHVQQACSCFFPNTEVLSPSAIGNRWKDRLNSSPVYSAISALEGLVSFSSAEQGLSLKGHGRSSPLTATTYLAGKYAEVKAGEVGGECCRARSLVNAFS